MALRKSKYAIGIDLGTTNTCAAVWKDGKVQVIPNKFGNYLTPSWISYTDVEVIVGQNAKDDAHKNFKGTLFGIKRIIGRKYDDPIVQEAIKNWKFTVRDQNSIPAIEVIYKKKPKLILPEEASALILKEIKEVAEEYLGEKGITDAVITVPAYFNDHQRQATKDAAKIAGLNVIRLINEPTAAAVAYVFDKADKLKRNILVYDLGGGTFDVSIIKVEDCCVQVLATNGDTNLGGENFDQRVIDHFIQLLKDKYDVDIADASKLGMLARLRRQVQKAKHELSSTSTTTVEIDYIDGKVDMKEELKRTLVDSLNSDLFERTIEIVKQCVAEAKLSKEDIDDIVLVGGSTRLTAIQRLLREYFGKKLCKGINQDQAVAHGAAILAANHNKALPESLIILDVISMSLGLHTADQKMDVLIKRNTQVPTQAKRTYTIAGTGARTMRIKILMGDNEKAVDNLSLGYFDLLDLPTNPRVDVTFKLDVNGILTVDATEASAGIQKAIDVLLEKGRLTDKEIAKLQRDFDALSEENKRYHQVRDIRNKFESYLLKLKDDVNKKKYEISEQEQNSLLKIAMEGELFLKSLNSYDLKHLSNEYANVNRQCTAILKTSTDKTSGNRKK